MTTHPDPVAAKKLRATISAVLLEVGGFKSEDDLRYWGDGRQQRAFDDTLAKLLAAITPHLPALTQLPVAGEDAAEACARELFPGIGFHAAHCKADAEHLRLKVEVIRRHFPAATPPSAPMNGDGAKRLRIVAAAVVHRGVVHTAPHHHLAMWQISCCWGEKANGAQGFVASDGKFYDRIESKRIAREADQIVFPLPHKPDELYSEELWSYADWLKKHKMGDHADAAPNAGAERLRTPVRQRLEALCTLAYHSSVPVTHHDPAQLAKDLAELLGHVPPPAGDGKASPQHATNDATPGASGSQDVGNGVAAPSSWAVELLERADDIITRADVIACGWPEARQWHNDYLDRKSAQSAGDGKDRERLDWWEKNPSRIVFSKGYHGSPDCWGWFDARGNYNAAPNLRAAIDAAMTGEQK